MLAFGFVGIPGVGPPGRADAAEFEVAAGHLSASVRDIVESHGWSLVWAADEDRLVDYPFVIDNGSLREALTDLLAIYGGQFVADLYEGNRVVLVDSAPPRIRVVLPGAAAGDDDVPAAARPAATTDPVDAAAVGARMAGQPAESWFGSALLPTNARAITSWRIAMSRAND